VSSAEPLLGNPVAVVHDADGPNESEYDGDTVRAGGRTWTTISGAVDLG
jgi:hypothetical protein